MYPAASSMAAPPRPPTPTLTSARDNCARSRGSLSSTQPCNLHIAPWTLGGLCSVPCKWKCALNLSASLGSSWPSVSAPNGVFKTTRHRRQRWAFRSWIGWIFSDKSGTSCGPAVGPGRNCQDSLAVAAVPQGFPLFAGAPCTQVSRRVARMGGSASAALGCLAFHL